MGTFLQWAMVRDPSLADCPQRLEDLGATLLVREREWTVVRAQEHDAAALAGDLARLIGQPALAGWVYDSDFAYVTGFCPDGPSFELIIGEPYDTEGEPGRASVLYDLATIEGRAASARALSAWSETCVDALVRADEGLRIIEAERTFAEEGVTELFNRLGIPDPFALGA